MTGVLTLILYAWYNVIVSLVSQDGLFNFHPAVRPVQLEVHIDGFPGKHYCPRMATMNKPTYTAIRTYSPTKPVLVFVSSRRQTRLTAFDLVAYVAREDNPKQWLHMAEDEVIKGSLFQQSYRWQYMYIYMYTYVHA